MDLLVACLEEACLLASCRGESRRVFFPGIRGSGTILFGIHHWKFRELATSASVGPGGHLSLLPAILRTVTAFIFHTHIARCSGSSSSPSTMEASARLYKAISSGSAENLSEMFTGMRLCLEAMMRSGFPLAILMLGSQACSRDMWQFCKGAHTSRVCGTGSST